MLLADLHLLDVFLEAMGPSGAGRFDGWLQQAIDREPPPPLELVGDGAEALATLLAHQLVRHGVDALNVPVSWVRSGRAELLTPPPAVVVVVAGYEDLAPVRLGRLSRRSGLVVAGDFTCPPVDSGAGGSVYLSLSASRAEDMRLHAALVS